MRAWVSASRRSATSIISSFERRDEVRDDVSLLAIDGDDHRIDRQFVVREHYWPNIVPVRHGGRRAKDNRGQEQQPEQEGRDADQRVDVCDAKRKGGERDKACGGDLAAAHAAFRGQAVGKALERVGEDRLSPPHPDKGGKPLRRSDGKAVRMQPARSPHLDQTRHGLRPGRNNRPRLAAARRERGNAASQTFDRVEMLGECRFAHVVRAAQMLRQCMIILLFSDDPFAEKSVQRLDASRRSGSRVQQTIRGNPMLRKEFEFRRKRARHRPEWTLAA